MAMGRIESGPTASPGVANSRGLGHMTCKARNALGWALPLKILRLAYMTGKVTLLGVGFLAVGVCFGIIAGK